MFQFFDNYQSDLFKTFTVISFQVIISFVCLVAVWHFCSLHFCVEVITQVCSAAVFCFHQIIITVLDLSFFLFPSFAPITRREARTSDCESVLCCRKKSYLAYQTNSSFIFSCITFHKFSLYFSRVQSRNFAKLWMWRPERKVVKSLRKWREFVLCAREIFETSRVLCRDHVLCFGSSQTPPQIHFKI